MTLVPRFARITILITPALATPLAGQCEGPPRVGFGGNLFDQVDRAVLGGRWWLRLRYRLETVDEDGVDRDAWASTLRTVLGYETAPWHGASATLEFEDVSVIGNDLYNDTLNGEPRPVVADPESTEVNQAFLKLLPAEEVVAKLGRQVITLDNHRFVGDVGWRQNQQTYDAVSVTWQPDERGQLFYGFVDNVNRVFGDDSPMGDFRMASSLANVHWDLNGIGRLTIYAYLLDFDTADVLSSNTHGARLSGIRSIGGSELTYAAEFARQTDAADNPNAVDQDYFLGELGAKARGFFAKASMETLGGSGDPGDAFQTPLATLHAFNGWADKFLSTPDTGLEDISISAGGELDGFDARLVWHDFKADSGGQDYGTELDASLTWRASAKVMVGLKLADYRAEDFATDTTKVWIWVSWMP